MMFRSLLPQAPPVLRVALLASLLGGSHADTILTNSCDSLAGIATTGDVVTRSAGCDQGSCFRMDGDGSPGRILIGVDTSGYSSVQLTFRAKTTSLESSDSCTAWWSDDAGASWTQFWFHSGPSEISWTTVSLATGQADNNPDFQLRYGTTGTTAADYCWFDTLQVEGTPGAGPTPTLAPTPVPAPTPAPAPTPTGGGPSSCPSCLPASTYDPLTGSGAVSRTLLLPNTLQTGSGASTTVLNWDSMAVPTQDAAMPNHSFEGTLSLPNVATESTNFVKILDDFNYDSDPERLHLPPIALQFISHGSHLVPATRGTRESTHPFWEFAVEPGRCWSETGDSGDTRCSLPFALTQRNSNCVHNGVLSFLFNNDNSGTISKVWYQIASETCLYYKFNFAALASAVYTNEAVANGSSLRSSHEAEVSSRIPSKPLADVAADLGGNAAALVPAIDTSHLTISGLLGSNGVHYRNFGPTRVPNGASFPYSDGLILPSYSTAKTHLYAAAVFTLEEQYPGALTATVGSLLPAAPSSKWDDVTLEDVADMATGNYRFTQYLRDESLLAVENNFFLKETDADRMDHALNYYSRKATPGTKWVYHTSDHYVGLAAAQEYLRTESGDPSASILDYMVTNVWTPMGGSELLFNSRTTYDSTSMPFGGYGLFYLPNDVALLAKTMNTDLGQILGTQVYDSTSVARALENSCSTDCGLPAGSLYYQSGVWRKDVGACEWVPFASGYGGITMAMLPGGSNFYYFSDNDEFEWSAAATEALRIEGTCP